MPLDSLQQFGSLTSLQAPAPCSDLLLYEAYRSDDSSGLQSLPVLSAAVGASQCLAGPATKELQESGAPEQPEPSAVPPEVHCCFDPKCRFQTILNVHGMSCCKVLLFITLVVAILLKPWLEF